MDDGTPQSQPPDEALAHLALSLTQLRDALVRMSLALAALAAASPTPQEQDAWQEAQQLFERLRGAARKTP